MNAQDYKGDLWESDIEMNWNEKRNKKFIEKKKESVKVAHRAFHFQVFSCACSISMEFFNRVLFEKKTISSMFAFNVSFYFGLNLMVSLRRSIEKKAKVV